MTIGVWRTRELLGDIAKNMTDAEVEAIRDHTRSLAEVCIDSFLAEQKKKRTEQNER